VCSEDVEIDHSLDVQRTLLNTGLFLSTIAGWRVRTSLYPAN
jgi:hypothetical protein